MMRIGTGRRIQGERLDGAPPGLRPRALTSQAAGIRADAPPCTEGVRPVPASRRTDGLHRAREACRRGAAILAALAALAAPASAQEPERRMLDAAEAERFAGVGRLNVAGTRFCTATLIAERVILTAAHCLFHPQTRRPVPLSELRFVAGQRRDAYVAQRGIRRAAPLPGFRLDARANLAGVRQDLAVLELDEAVPPDVARAFTVAPIAADAAVTVVSYARDRAQAASIERDCAVQLVDVDLVILGCEVTYGISGAPVFAMGPEGLRLVAVISAIGEVRSGEQVALAAATGLRVAALTAELFPPE